MSKLRMATMNPGPITLDVVGQVLNAEDRRRILHPLTGGVILFGRNFANRQQLTKLTAAIKKLRPDVLISIDHEGGRVQRCRTDGFTHLPAMKKLGDIWTNGGKKAHAEHALKAMEAATAVGFVLASELRAVSYTHLTLPTICSV